MHVSNTEIFEAFRYRYKCLRYQYRIPHRLASQLHTYFYYTVSKWRCFNYAYSSKWDVKIIMKVHFELVFERATCLDRPRVFRIGYAKFCRQPRRNSFQSLHKGTVQCFSTAVTGPSLCVCVCVFYCAVCTE